MQASAAYTAFVDEAEPRLRRALVARFGMQLGRDATMDALVYAWQHWDRIADMENPVGYLYRVGCSSVRPRIEPPPLVSVHEEDREPWIEPGLEAGLDDLTEPHDGTAPAWVQADGLWMSSSPPSDTRNPKW